MPVTHEVASSSLVVPAIKRSHLVWLFLMAELIVARSVFASCARELRLERFCVCVENTLAKRVIAVNRDRARHEPRRSRHLKRHLMVSFLVYSHLGSHYVLACLGFPPRSQSFAYATYVAFAQSVRYPD